MASDIDFIPRLVNAGDDVYPPSLRELSAPPRQLWIAGRQPGVGDALIAVVGSRAVSQKGCGAVSHIASDLVGLSWSVISGGALGIDAAAHRGALAGSGSGRTWAVLGCGVDVIYPDRHGALFRAIRESGGGLMSEYPPGTPPRAGQFPARNRVVAALARAVLVGESRRGSGALITARWAAKLGRPVFAIPGSFGTDRLLASGAAAPVASAGDLVDGLAAGRPCQVSAPPAEMEEWMILLKHESMGAAELASRSGVSLERMLAMLSEAELEGWVLRAAGGKFEVNRGN